MPTATLTCPRCSSSLRTTTPFGVGSRFRCPGCGCDFAVGEEDRTLAEPPGPPAAVPGVRPLPPPAADAPKRPSAWPILLGVVALALLLLAGAGVALAIHFLPKRETTPVAAAPATAAPAADSSAPPADPADTPDDKRASPPRPQATSRPSPGLPPPLLAPPDPPPQSVLPPEEQDKVNKAVERGRAYLEKGQLSDGSWSKQKYAVGLTALPGLTLLECGAPSDDPHVRKAAEFVRKRADALTSTYELSLAILFLDRLGDPGDEPLIRTLALRLLTGESSSGGWSYECRKILPEKQEKNVWAVLEATRPRSGLELLALKSGDKSPDDLFAPRPAARPDKAPGAVAPLTPGPTDEERKEAKKLYDQLPHAVRNMPALQPPTRDDRMPDADETDNSNTQFAALGLWAAGRHGVPMERALALLAKRFQVSQTPKGRWNYNYQLHPDDEDERPAMTAAGLLGLAVGHGLTADVQGPDVAPVGEDPLVEKGMKALGQYVGRAHEHGKARNRSVERNYYLLWSVERVGMLYGRKTIGENEWYPWGAEDLVELQGKDGGWSDGDYPGHNTISEPYLADACFALLFLKRANFVRDLSDKLEFLSQLKKP